MSKTDEPMTGAEAVLHQLAVAGVDCLFVSPIAVMAPVWEAIAARGEAERPAYYRCRHEALAVSLASGYYKATGRSQVVFLPTSLGVQNGAMALRTALLERTPMTVLSPDTLTYGESPDSDPGPEWPSLLVDFWGPARDGELVTKWARQARTAADVVHELRRARYLTDSVPRGPTLLEIPFDLLLGQASSILHPLLRSSQPMANPDEIAAATEALASAETPLIITEYVGRTSDERQDLVRVAEALGAPVFEFMQPAFRTFPRNHPLYCAGAVEPVLGQADAILVAGCNAPWHPPLQALKPDCKVIHLEEDPLRPRAPYYGYRTTHCLAGDRALNLRALADRLCTQPSTTPARVERWREYSESVRALGIEEAETARADSSDAVPAAELFRALHRLLPETAVCVDEIIAPMPQMLQFLYEEKPFEQFRGWMGALGTSLGTALGVKLARPQSPVVCIVGDGAWHYNPIPAALGFSQEYGVPLLVVLCNNRQYASQTWNVLRYYPNGAAVRTGNFVGNKIEPMPNYVKTVEAYGGAGERVQSIEALEPAIRKGLEVVATGQTFLLDTVLQ